VQKGLEIHTTIEELLKDDRSTIAVLQYRGGVGRNIAILIVNFHLVFVCEVDVSTSVNTIRPTVWLFCSADPFGFYDLKLKPLFTLI
jgi:hypothetical protein